MLKQCQKNVKKMFFKTAEKIPINLHYFHLQWGKLKT